MSPNLFIIILLLLFLTTTQPTISKPTCTKPLQNTQTKYQTCIQLPTLSSTLHYTYNHSNSTLSVAFTTTPPTPSSYVSYAINPSSLSMLKAQAFIAYNSPSTASLILNTFNLSSYTSVSPSPLSFPVYDKRVVFNSGDGSVTIFVVVGSNGGVVNHVWQVGPGVTDGVPDHHQLKEENLGSKLSFDVSSKVVVNASGSGSGSGSGGVDTGLRNRNIHGILNAISWGLLFPFGAIISRYLRTFESADPTWFYLHAICQTSAYAIGVAGWATGLKLGSETEGIVYQGHRCIGIGLFSLATLQILALFVRPKKDHKYRLYWNIYHHSVGYAIIILGIINVFKGLDILEPEKKWRSTYVITLLVLGGIALLLEALTWVVVLRRKSNRSTKPYA